MKRRRLVLSITLSVLGAGLVVSGVALWSRPAAMVLAGLAVLAAGLVATDVTK